LAGRARGRCGFADWRSPAEDAVASFGYSNDGGATWQPLSLPTREETVVFDARALPGGDRCLLELTVTDGFHTTRVQSKEYEGSHAGKTSIKRLEGAWENLRLIHLPIHASWLNQIELYFSIVQRKALTPNDFGNLDELTDRLLAFEEHYRRIAQPFDWTFTR